jgi:hypothetical protein
VTLQKNKVFHLIKLKHLTATVIKFSNYHTTQSIVRYKEFTTLNSRKSTITNFSKNCSRYSRINHLSTSATQQLNIQEWTSDHVLKLSIVNHFYQVLNLFSLLFSLTQDKVLSKIIISLIPHTFLPNQNHFCTISLGQYNTNNKMDKHNSQGAPLSQLTVLTNPYAKKNKEGMPAHTQDTLTSAQPNLDKLLVQT